MGNVGEGEDAAEERASRRETTSIETRNNHEGTSFL
jgi:hypothetical protein